MKRLTHFNNLNLFLVSRKVNRVMVFILRFED